MNKNREIIIKTASSLNNFDEWFPLDDFKEYLGYTEFELEKKKHPRLIDYIVSLSDLFKVKIDPKTLNSKVQKYYITFIGKPVLPPEQEPVTNEEISETKKGKLVLSSIAKNWKLEAKLEKEKDYFYHVDEVNSILKGEKYYIIGRKGTGKSMISEYLLNLRDAKTFTQKLSFKNFPFNDLYNLGNPKYTRPNQYITLWKFLIYSNVAKLMGTNQKVEESTREALNKLYNPDPLRSLSRRLNRWTSAGFGVEIAGFGTNLDIGRESIPNDISWFERVNILEDIIFKYCDDSQYFIIFDELDEDYRDIKDEDHETYKFLLTSLFKAVQDIKATFIESNLKILPVIFLRDDIYSLIKDADKNKWRDFMVEIEWNEDKIKQLLAWRISIDLNENKPLLFREAWELIFEEKEIKKGSNKKLMDSFEYISRSTHLRPRDFIRYIQVCAADTISNDRSKISNRTIKFVDRAFSNYLRDEIIDEVFPVIPDVETIFQIISNMRKPIFSINEFRNEYLKYYQVDTVNNNLDFVLDILFKFSVLGNLPRYQNSKGQHFFKYLHTNMNLNKNEKLTLHRGLFKAFQIL